MQMVRKSRIPDYGQETWSPRENASDAEPASKYVLQMRFSLQKTDLE